MEIFVHDTAFMIAYYRAQHEEVSKDPYAHLWLRPGLEKWTNEFARHVSSKDDILHCLRNRFFYEELRKLTAEHDKLLLLNLGAGFSMYPYALPDHLETIEVDFTEVAQYKELKTTEFNNLGRLPGRKVLHLHGDITNASDQKRFSELLAPYKDHTKVVLIEGVFFFLSEAQITSTLNFCEQVLTTGDQLMCVSFDDALKQTAVFNRLTLYFSEVLKSENNPYTTLPHSYYRELDAFQLIRQSSSVQLGKELAVIEPNLDENDVLNEYFYVLERR
ncbi:MAG: class I SAM-dependent methyltransferase [Bacteroidota bacterium]